LDDAILPEWAGKCQELFALALAAVILGTACANTRTAPASTPEPGTAAVVSPAASGTPSPQVVEGEETGVVRKVGDFGYGLVPDRDPGTRYAPSNLPEELKKDGLRVAWTGQETEPPAGVRMWGTPYRIEKIRAIATATP
jgi:hypothetical protein